MKTRKPSGTRAEIVLGTWRQGRDLCKSCGRGHRQDGRPAHEGLTPAQKAKIHADARFEFERLNYHP